MAPATRSPQERRLRSRLAQLVHERPLIRATLNARAVTCGKKGCRCAQGEKHPALYLVCTVKSQRRQWFVPPSMEAEVRNWVENYHAAQELLEQISEGAWQRLKARKQEEETPDP